ncbi:hypothetical protein RND81_11G173700 [Saponaria officinalis]|uniref:Peroxisomal membrane protein 11A n=1 Tax=Saponaria officinalis TaxID=3572 RepID=A0AAW1HN74_SAPOF
MKPQSNESPPSPPPPPPAAPPQNRDVLIHLEAYLAKRDGVDKLLKISRYASKLILSTSLLPESLPLTRRLKSFESSVGVSRKAFRLGKFIQDVNSLNSILRSRSSISRPNLALAVLAYGGEGVYYFLEQFVWLSKSGLIDARYARRLQIFSAWAEFVGYIGSISLKFQDLTLLNRNLACLSATVEISIARGDNCDDDRVKLRVLKDKTLLKKMSIVQDLADAFMALADIRDGLSSPLLLSCAGLLSALISTHKNWVSC